MNTQPHLPHAALLNAAKEFNTAWGVTMPAELVATPAAKPFNETIRGLVTREVDEPELFKLFFG
jgi:hypothetical protein